MVAPAHPDDGVYEFLSDTQVDDVTRIQKQSEQLADRSLVIIGEVLSKEKTRDQAGDSIMRLVMDAIGTDTARKLIVQSNKSQATATQAIRELAHTREQLADKSAELIKVQNENERLSRAYETLLPGTRALSEAEKVIAELRARLRDSADVAAGMVAEGNSVATMYRDAVAEVGALREFLDDSAASMTAASERSKGICLDGTVDL